jgi:hypothetical protein
MLLLAITDFGRAQEDEEIVTDRPDLTESADTVGHLRLQIETGINWEKVSTGADERLLAFGTLLRYGWGERFEFRIEGDSFSRLEVERRGVDESFSGFAPIGVGMKYTLHKGTAIGEPTVAVIMMVELPSGTDEFETQDAAPSATLTTTWDLDDIFSLGINAGVDNQRDDADSFYAAFGSASLGIGLGGRWGMFLELAGRSATSGDGDGVLLGDGGFTFLVNSNLQLDAALGTGLAGDAAPDLFFTAGMSVRF